MTLIKNPVLKINGKTVKYQPNTLKQQSGKPSRIFSATTVDSAITITEDPADAIGMVSFDLRSIPENISLFEEWINNGDDNSITISGNENKSMSRATVSNPNVEIERGSDSDFTVEFKGNPIQ